MIVSTLPDDDLAEAVASARRQAVAAAVEARARALVFSDLAARQLMRRAIHASLEIDDECDFNGAIVRFVGVKQCPAHGARVLIAYRNNVNEWGPVRECGPDVLDRLRKRTSKS